MTAPTFTPVADHALDVLRFAQSCLARGEAVSFAIVTETLGGAVRSPGAIMTISETGKRAGYVSGGCIDADVCLQAQNAIKTGSCAKLRYGQGSKFVDLKLPCGGAISVLIWVAEDTGWLKTATDMLARRGPVSLIFDPDVTSVAVSTNPVETGWHGNRFCARVEPKLKLRIAGRGADAITLTRLAHASGFDIAAQTPDEDFLLDLSEMGLTEAQHLTVPSQVPTCDDDEWTAFLLMFHDLDWEVTLLKQALASNAFYIGAVGSARTHAVRCDALIAAGVTERDIQRMSAPIGLIPAMRDASMLAVSALAEVVARFHDR